MLKSKALFTALLLTLSFNTFAFCVHNQTSKPVYLAPGEGIFITDQDWYSEHSKEIVPGDKFCSIEGKPGVGFILLNNKYPTGDAICWAIWTNFTTKDIHVIPDGESQTCLIS